jgi:hypothetical protein
VPRIELLTSMFAGACGGLTGILWNGVVSAMLLRGLSLPPALAAGSENLRTLLAGVAAHVGAGALQGLLFWASWSLIALVHTPWYLVGVAFGLACWGGIALPVMLTLGLRLSIPVRLLIVHAGEWLVSCVAVGLFCAYSWRHVV